MPITHTDGKEYFSSDEVSNTVKERLRGVEEKLTQAEQKYKAVEPQLASIQSLTSERDTLKTAAQKAADGLSRFKAAASHGITDPDTLEALEAAYEKTMSKVEEGKRAPFDGYLNHAKSDPSVLPSYLRSVFAGSAQGQPGGAGQQQGAGGQGGAAGGQGAGAQQQGAGQQQGGAAGGQQANRPAWAPAIQGQQKVDTGQQQQFTDRVQGAKTLDELAAIQAERVRSRQR